jgi:tetratricopeptide (TPR) repeat protein
MIRAAAGALSLATSLLLGGPALSDQKHPLLDELFRQLAGAGSAAEAAGVEERIWSLWLESGQSDVEESLERGMLAMGTGDYAAARLAFDRVVAAAPGFAEGWNKRATLYFLMGNFEASLRDIERTLALEPRHFGALSGLAMIREAQGRPFQALEALERVQHVHPRLPHLAERVERLTRQLGDPI